MDQVSVATSGSIPRRDICHECGTGMLYRVDVFTKQPVAMFCGCVVTCSQALKESPVPEARPAQLQSPAETSDSPERLLYDVLEVVGPLGALLREEKSEFLKRKGAELIELWRRGEHLGVLKGERP